MDLCLLIKGGNGRCGRSSSFFRRRAGHGVHAGLGWLELGDGVPRAAYVRLLFVDGGGRRVGRLLLVALKALPASPPLGVLVGAQVEADLRGAGPPALSATRRQLLHGHACTDHRLIIAVQHLAALV